MYVADMNLLRYSSQCLIYANIGRTVEFVVDTGARYTCVSYRKVNKLLNEKDMKGNEYKIFAGYAKDGRGIIHYKYRINRFDIGDIQLGEQDIWITFDPNASDSILGIDMLQQVTFLQIENMKKLMFFRNVTELRKFIQEHLEYLEN